MMNEACIYFPPCLKDVLPELKPQWRNWLIISVIKYQIDGSLPKFPTRLSKLAIFSWKFFKSHIDCMSSPQQDADGTQLNDDLTQDVVDEIGCKNCKQMNSTTQLEDVKPCTENVVDETDCKNCKQISTTIENDECADYEEVSDSCETEEEKNNTFEDLFDAKGCKNCKQMEVIDDLEEFDEEETKKTKKRNSPCTPYRKENKKRKEEDFPLYPPKGEEKKENYIFKGVVEENEDSGTEVEPEVIIEDNNSAPFKQRRMKATRKRLKMIYEKYNQMVSDRLRPLGKLDETTYKLLHRVATKHTDEEIFSTVSRALDYNCMNGHNQYDFQADFFYLFKDLVYVRIHNNFYDFGDNKSIIRDEQYRIGTAEWWAENAEQMEEERRRMEAEVAAAYW